MFRDHTGECFDDADAAHKAAVRGVSELIAEQIVAGHIVDLAHRIDIEDENGNIATVRFGDLFQGAASDAHHRAPAND